MNMLEKIANNLGVIYRFQKLQFPRRWDLLIKVAKRELAPPTIKDWPTIQKHFKAVLNSIEKQEYKNYTVSVNFLFEIFFINYSHFYFWGT